MRRFAGFDSPPPYLTKTNDKMKNTQNNKLEQAIEAMGAYRGRSFPDLFSDFLDLTLTLLCNNPTEHQRKLMQDTFADERRKAAFLTALKAYGEAAEGFHDPLGDMFMTRISHGQNGQFFTPEHICDFMARIADPKDESINDPCCGSGRLLLAGLKVARESGNDPVIYANDLSYTCSQMCLMNLLFNSAGGEVSCGNSLMMDLQNFRFFHIDRVMTPEGKWWSTYWQYTMADVDEVNELRNEWFRKMAANGVPVEIRCCERKAANDEPTEDAPVQEAAEIVPEEEPQPDRLTATPKAVQLELQLF